MLRMETVSELKVGYRTLEGHDSVAYVDEHSLRGTDKYSDRPLQLIRVVAADGPEDSHWVYEQVADDIDWRFNPLTGDWYDATIRPAGKHREA
jgi:hypothetical protein